MASDQVELVANGTLLHRQLYVSLKEQILGGQYRAGERLPTQEEFCDQFSVSRITVRRALADLQSEGFIRNKRGGGTFVAEGQASIKQRSTLGFIEQLHRVVHETKVKVLLIEEDRSPSAVGHALCIGDSGRALHVIRTRSQERTPVMLLDAWIPLAFAGKVTAKALATEPLYRLIAGSSDQLGRVVQEVNAGLAGPMVARALAIELNSAVLKTSRLIHNRAGAPIQYVTLWSTPLRSRMVMEFDANDIDQSDSGRMQHFKQD